MFKPLPDKFTYPQLEEEILKFWDDNEIFDKTLEKGKDSPYFTFYEGPPTVNGKPGLHHMMARTIKDSICRYKTMQGYYVRRQAGWDTHGLPVEIQIEKKLGIKNKNEIETFGIDKFNQVCKDSVYENIEMGEGWRTLTKRMGYWVDLDSAYITCTNNYIESVWWALKQFFDKGLIYRGFKVVPQSPTIETPLSSHELSLGYKDVKDPSCFLKLKLVEGKKESLVGKQIMVWTTTPWTLFANVGLAVGEDIDYVLVYNKRVHKQTKEENEDYLILAEARLSILDGDYEIIEKFKGSELIGSRYNQILPYVDLKLDEHPNGLSIVAGDFVTTADGTGIVHIAPAFGVDDYEIAKDNNFPFVQPVTPNGHLTEDCGEFSGRAIKNFTYDDHTEEGVDKDTVIKLKQLDKIYRSTNDYLHSYPHCWRTDNPIMYYARESWFIKSPEYKDELVSLNEEINWQPKEVGSGRFGNWLKEVKEWSLSRDRFWGTPLPLWVNEEDPEDIMACGSIEDLCKGMYVFEDGKEVPVAESGVEIDLHRPFVDNVIFRIDGKKYKRVHEVIDVWFDSGSMPFAQMHYPFENQELFEKSFPADFIAEGIDQTRGWFYTLHNISTALFGKPAFKNIVVNELILDKNGVKMSKSKGNSVDPFDAMDRLGADAVRWYLFVNNPPWRTTLFNEDDITKTVISDFFRSITNTYAFFTLYANIDGFDGSEDFIDFNDRPEIDKWILSRINSILKYYKEQMDEYELTKAHRAIQTFAINELSNWYIRRNRRRFWKGEKDSDKIAAYQTLREVLMKLVSIMSPLAPFLAESLFQRLRLESDSLSIHLSNLPKVDENLIDLSLENKMEIAQKIVNLSRSLREKERIRTRQPLKRILLPIHNVDEQNDILTVGDIIKEEINVKEIEFVSDTTSNIVSRSAKPNFKVLGKKYGKQTNIVANYIRTFDNDQILGLEKGIVINYEYKVGEDTKVTEIVFDDIEVTSEDIQGWLVATDQGVTVALDTELTKELVEEGIVREFINRVQNLRKDSGFEVTDRIDIVYSASETVISAIDSMKDHIANETLAVDINVDREVKGQEIELLDEKINIVINKI